MHLNRKFECPECNTIFTSSFRLKTHLKNQHDQTAVNTKSTIVISKGNLITVAPEAKEELIKVQHLKIENLRKQIQNAKINRIHLQLQVEADIKKL